MSHLADEVLLKRARDAGKNLSLLAMLASVLTAVLIGAALFIHTLPQVMLVLAVSLVLVSSGYWALAMAARRGNPASVAIVIVLMVGQFVFAMVSSGVVAAQNGGVFRPNLPGVIIPILVIAALFQSREVLLQLRARGLWDQVFVASKTTTGLCVVGGTLLMSGVLGLHGFMEFAGYKAGDAREAEARHAKCFVEMIATEERVFVDAMRNTAGDPGERQISVALEKLGELEHRLQALKRDSRNAGSMSVILDTYGNALRQWKNGLENLIGTSPDPRRAQELLKLGDRLRTEAAQAFDLNYGPEQKS